MPAGWSQRLQRLQPVTTVTRMVSTVVNEPMTLTETVALPTRVAVMKKARLRLEELPEGRVAERKG